MNKLDCSVERGKLLSQGILVQVKILSVANISKRKEMDYLIEALKCFNSSKIYLTMVGLPNESGKQMMQKIKLILFPTLDEFLIVRFFYFNDVFILVSLTECSSLRVYEVLH